MTPELIKACQIIFQEHKGSLEPIAWKKDVFRGRVSMGLCEMAKDTLLRKNVILFTNKSKKLTTVLNPAVADALRFEEAIEMAASKKPVLMPVRTAYEVMEDGKRQGVQLHKTSPTYIYRSQRAEQAPATAVEFKWYMKPLYYYVLWPVCGAILGILLAWGLSFVASLF